jgi:hypothetical protein
MKRAMSLGVIVAFAVTAWVSASCGSPKCGTSGCPVKAAEKTAEKVIG